MLNYNLISLIDFLALLQGLILGGILLFERWKDGHTKFLGLFLLTFSLALIDPILMRLGVYRLYPRLIFVPVNFYFLSVPLFYLYVKTLLMPVSNRRILLILIPGINEFLFFCVLFFLPIAKKYALIQSPNLQRLYTFYANFSMAFSILFALLAIRLVERYRKNKLGFSSNTPEQRLLWVRYIALFLIYFYGTAMIRQWMPHFISGYIYALAFSLTNIFIIYWVGIVGLRQPGLTLQYESGTPIQKPQPSPKPIPATDATQDELMEQLQHLFEQKYLYRDTDLTLPKLAKQLGVSRRELSQVINQSSGHNFNKYVNHYRIQEAKQLLANPEYHQYNMVGIANEVGFSSKATFFSVFKKATGMSPGQYKKKKLAKQPHDKRV